MRLGPTVPVHVALQSRLGAEVGVADAAVERAAVAVEVDPQEVRVEELVADGAGTTLLVSGALEVFVPESG